MMLRSAAYSDGTVGGTVGRLPSTTSFLKRHTGMSRSAEYGSTPAQIK